jgi:hypothetical protein
MAFGLSKRASCNNQMTQVMVLICREAQEKDKPCPPAVFSSAFHFFKVDSWNVSFCGMVCERMHHMCKRNQVEMIISHKHKWSYDIIRVSVSGYAQQKCMPIEEACIIRVGNSLLCWENSAAVVWWLLLHLCLWHVSCLIHFIDSLIAQQPGTCW